MGLFDGPGITKIIPPGSQDFGVPVAALVDVHSRGVDKAWMTKRASVLSDEIKRIRPEEKQAFLHLISLGAMEFYGSNRNGDSFNEKSAAYQLPEGKTGVFYKMADGLSGFHDTFTKHGHVFKHHRNQDPMLKIGEVVAQAYNPDMHRGELIIKVPINNEWSDDLVKLASGKDIAFSMACRVPYDVCTICGNMAPSRAEYCDHARHHLTEITKYGHQVSVINDRPDFFDISKVFKPADRIAWSLQKVASAAAGVIGGAELAEQLNVAYPHRLILPTSFVARQKLAAARKLAEIEKQVEAVAKGSENPQIKQLLGGCPCGNIPDDESQALKGSSLSAALQGLTDAKICLSVSDFIKLVMGSKSDSIADEVPKVKELLPGLFNRLLSNGEAEECATDSAYDPEHTAIPRHVRDVVTRLAGDHSLAEGPVGRRMQLVIIRGMTPKLASYDLHKTAAVSAKSAHLAREYASYQLAFARAHSDDLSSRLMVLRNYCA